MADEQGLSVVIGADTTPLIRATQQADAAIAGFATQTAKRAEAAAQAMETIATRANPALVAARREWGALERQLPGTAAALAKLKLVTEQADAALQAGRITAEQHAKAVGDLKLRYDANAIAAKKAADEQSRAMAALESKAQSLKDALNPASKAQRDFSERVAEADKMLASGLITYGEHADAVKRYRAALEQASGTHETAAKSTKLAAHEIQNLSFQVQDAVTQLAGGGSPLLILAQQGPQATAAVGGTGRALSLLTTPTALATAGIAAVAGAGALVVSRMVEISNESKRLTAQVGVLNPSLAVTAEQLRQMSFAVADQGASRSEGMAALTAVISNARIQSAGLVEQIAKLSVDLAALKGGTAADWATKLADAAGKGAQGFSDLGETLPGLTANTLAAARAAEAQGDRLGAAKLAMAELEQQYGGSAKQMKSDFGNAVDEMGRKWDTLLEHMANSGPAKASIGFISGALEGFDRWLNGTPAVVDQATKLAAVRAALDRELASLNDLQDQGAGGKVLEQQITKVRALQTEYYALATAVRAASGGGGGTGGTNGTGGTGAGGASGGPQPPITGAIVGLNERDKDKLNLATDAMKRQAEGAKLLSQNLSVSARATAENRIALADLAMQYPGLGAGTANAILTSKDFAATLKTLPQPLQDVFQAMEKNSANKLAGDLAMATVGLTSEANAAKLAAEAAGLGEAAMRKASLEAEVYAHRMDGTAAAVREAREQQEQFVRQQIHNEFARGIDQEVAANARLAAAYGTSGKAVEEASRYNEAYLQTLKEAVPGEDGWTEALDRNIKKLKERDLSRLSKDIAAYGDALRKANEDAQVELSASRLGDLAALEMRARYDALKAMGLTIEKYQLLDEATRRNVDLQLDAAAAIAKQRQEVDNYKSAWDTVTGSLEKSFERIGDALVQAIVSGQKASINLGTIWKSIAASFLSDIAKLASVDLRRMLGLGGNTTGSLLDLFGGKVGQAGQTATGGGVGVNDLVSLGQTGYSIYSGTNTLGTLANTFATSSAGTYLGLSATQAITPTVIGGQGIMVLPTTGTAVGASTPVLTSSGASFTSGLSAVGAAAPYGFLGGIGGSYIANNFANGNRVVGGVSGAALGVGTMAAGTAIAGAAGLSSAGAAAGAGMAGAYAGLAAIPVYGWIAAAVLAAVTAIMGSRGKAPIPYGGAWVDTDSTGQVTNRAAGAENGVDQKALEQRVDAINSVMSGIAQAGGFSYGAINIASEYQGGKNGKGNRTLIGGWDGTLVSTSDDVARIGLDALRYLRDSGRMTGGDDLSKRVLNKAIENGNTDSIESAIKAIGLAKSITDSTTALSEFDKSLQGVAMRAKKAQADSLRPFLEELELAGKYELKPEYTALAKQQFTAMIDDLRNPAQYTQVEIDMATLRGTFGELHQAAARLDPALVALVDTMGNEAIAARAANENKALNVQLAEALGHGFINQINASLEGEQINARNLTALGQPITRAQELRAAQLNNILQGLTAGELDFVTATYGATSDIGRLAQVIRGQLSGSIDTAVQSVSDFSTAFRQIQIDNANETIRALEAQQTAAEQTKSTWEGLARSVSQARLGFLTDTNLSILNPEQRKAEALRQFRETLAKAQGGDTQAATDLPALGRSLLEAARAFDASTPAYAAIFNEVQAGLSGVETVAARQLNLAATQLTTLQQQLATQQGILQALNRPAQTDVNAVLSGLNSSNLGDLVQWGRRQGSDVLMQVLQTADSRLGMAGNPYRYGAPADVQAIANTYSNQDFLDVARNIGFTGTIDQLNPWIVAYGKQGAFEAAVRARGAVRQYAAGTPSAPPGWAWVGEKGPELLNLSGGETILPHVASMQYAAANDRMAAPMMPSFGGSAPASYDREMCDLLRSVVGEVKKLVRVSAAAGDGNLDGLAAVERRLAKIEAKSRLADAA